MSDLWNVRGVSAEHRKMAKTEALHLEMALGKWLERAIEMVAKADEAKRTMPDWKFEKRADAKIEPELDTPAEPQIPAEAGTRVKRCRDCRTVVFERKRDRVLVNADGSPHVCGEAAFT